MSNEYFVPGPQRARRVGDLFARIALRYDRINDLQSFGLHRWWKRRVARYSGARPGLRALDVCTGTGDIAFALARAGARVVGLDFSDSMLAVAQRRAKRARSAVEFIRGNALQLPFADASFDIVTVGYGLRNLSDWRAGLSEMLRVARVEAWLVVLDFGKPDRPWWRAVYYGYLRTVVPFMGRLFCGDAAAYAYILESLQHYPGQRGLADAMRELGCAEVRLINILGGVMSINLGRKTDRGSTAPRLSPEARERVASARMDGHRSEANATDAAV